MKEGESHWAICTGWSYVEGDGKHICIYNMN